MNAPMQPDDWRPAQPRVRRLHVYVAIGTLAVLAVLGALFGGGGSLGYYFRSVYYTYFDGTYDDIPSLLDTPAPAIAPISVVARDAEALEAGFEQLQAWTEIEMTLGEEQYVDMAAEVGYEYLLLARAAEGCNVDAIIDSEVRDVGDSPDATLQFYVDEPAHVSAVLQAYPSNAATCVVGYGVYRR